MPAKNRTFKRRFVIELEGITTNDFMVEMTERMLKTMMQAIEADFKQVKVTKFESVDLRDFGEQWRQKNEDPKIDLKGDD